jgi:redox-sensing transcriptional repressor
MPKHNEGNEERDFTKIPRVVIKRLFRYHSVLERLQESGVRNVSSLHLSEEIHVKASQLRKDLAYCGEFGTRGKGYEVEYLHAKLSKILGLETEWPFVLAGLGRVGYALANYPGIMRRGFKLKGIFDIDKSKIGTTVNGVKIMHPDDMAKIVKQHGVKIGLIIVPAEAAQEVCDMMVNAGIKAILNFAPTTLKTKKPIFIERVDISRELVTLSYYLTYHSK